MKWSGLEATSGGGCKEHPNDKQVPGVCASCLRDKLSQLYKKNHIDPIYYCYPSPSSPASPQPLSSATGSPQPLSSATASHATGSASCMLSFNYGLNLKKSKSLVFATRNRVTVRDVIGGGGRKKDGFWSKVLKLKRKDTEDSVVNSRT